MGSFTIATGKEGSTPKKPLFLVSIVAPDGDTCYLTTAAYYGAPNIVYGGNTYLARIQKNDLQAIQAMSPQGYDSVPGFMMTLADADKFLWTNHCVPHGWRGATVTLTAILWDVVANTYSTDAIQWTFIGGNPQHNHAAGQTTLDVMSATNFTRLKIPSVPLQYTCPWDFPPDGPSRIAALYDPTSPYYQCGYSADQAGGVGNYASGTTCFTSCDKTRSGGPPGGSGYDPSVGCMARHGNASSTGVAPDGDLAHDKAGHYTARFGGVTLIMPTEYGGRQYVTGNKVFGFNQPNTSIAGSYFNWVYGTQWVTGMVLAPAGDPNSLRSEVVLCVAPFGAVTVYQVLVNGVLVPHDYSDPLFTWRFANESSINSGAGGRSGAINGDKYFSTSSYSGLGDPHGSLCVIEIVVPAELASPGSVPTVQALVSSGPLLHCYPIASVSGGIVTFTVPNSACAGNPPFSVLIVNNSNAALNQGWELSNWTLGPPGTVTLSGTSASGTGGAVFFAVPPSLLDTGYNISTQDSVTNGPAANPVWTALDLMSWGNIAASQIDPVSWYNAAAIAENSVSYVGADGNTYSHAQFKTCLQLPGNSRQTLASVLTGLRNSANLMIGPNSTTGLIQCYVKQTLHDQQSSAITGSNDSTARASMPATANTPSILTPGYYAYTFDETNIEKDSFKVTSTRIEGTPNTVSFSFQDEYNSYQTDSVTEIDPVAYQYSGNQEIEVPIPINGIANFDQATRISNVQLAEALYGNARNDPGGTLYFEFTVNHRVLHLAGRLGYICGLVWQELGIGTVSLPQPVRILSLKPDTDGEHWNVKCAWHNDEWYTYAYGQNPTPYQQNPLLGPPQRPPYPWRPGVPTWSSTDALFPNLDSFDFGVSVAQYPAQLSISGNAPNNAQPIGVLPPLVPLQASPANTGGSIPPGSYQIAFSPNGQVGPLSQVVGVVVPAGTSTNTITVSPLQWRSGAAPSIQPFIGGSVMNMRACASGSYSSATPDSNGNPTEYTFTSVTPDGLGLPDINFSNFLVEQIPIVHGGVWGDDITSVDGTGLILSFPEVTWSSNQWAGYVLSLYYRPGSPLQPGLNMVVTSSTANTLTMPSTGFLAGDIVVMRAVAITTHTANTIGCSNFVNWYAPSGLTVSVDQHQPGEMGNLVQIIGGTGAWTTPKKIQSNTATVLTISGTFDITPDATSVFIVLAATIASYYTPAFSGGGTGEVPIATTPAITNTEQALLVTVATCDQNGNCSPMQYQPSREVYIPPQPFSGLPRTVTASGTQQTLDGTLTFNTAGITQPTADVLNGAITSGQTTLTLTTGTASVNGTQIIIDSERILILAGGGSTSITNCIRGFAGTTMASHSNGAAVTLPGGLVFDLLATADWPVWAVTFNKTSTDINYVKLMCAGGDSLPGDNPSALPTSQILPDASATRGTVVFKAPNT